MTKSTYYGATILLQSEPDSARLAEIAGDTMLEHFPGDECDYRVVRALPEGLPTDVADQLSAGARDNPDAVFLLVYPTLKETYTNVKVPR